MRYPARLCIPIDGHIYSVDDDADVIERDIECRSIDKIIAICIYSGVTNTRSTFLLALHSFRLIKEVCRPRIFG